MISKKEQERDRKARDYYKNLRRSQQKIDRQFERDIGRRPNKKNGK